MFSGWNKKPAAVRTETVRVASKPVVKHVKDIAQRPKTLAPPKQTRPSLSPRPSSEAPTNSAARSRTTQLRQSLKRKSASPSPLKLQSDSEDDDDSFSSAFATPPPTKRNKLGGTSELVRRGLIRDREADKSTKLPLIHGLSLVVNEASGKFVDVFPNEDENPAKAHLQYPGSARREAFRLVDPKESDGYRPLEDIVETMETVLKFYFPPSRSEPFLDESSGLRRRIFRAYKRRDLRETRDVIEDYNQLIHGARQDGSIAKHMDEMDRLPLPVIKCVLNQIYARTVSPRVELLRQYEAASNNVYGEMLPPFVSQIFRDARMDSDSVFLDLGSGVGNVVLQAALEVGCEAHGIEVMENACVAARAQESEFKPRCRLWGLATGTVNLMQGDFLADPRVNKILQRADVVLVNNQAFQPDLNDALKIAFLDMKEGARLVSLKTFANEDLKERNQNDVTAAFEVEQKSFYQNYVSWMGGGGTYYVATKDSAGIERRLREKRRGR